MADVTEEAIWNVEEYDEIFEYADTLGVPLDGLNELSDMKERLVMQLLKNEYGNPKTLIAKSLEVSSKEDSHKRSKIGVLLGEFQKTILEYESSNRRQHGKGLEAMEDMLRTEGTVTDLKLELAQHIERMDKGECVFVVAGETSAGKSSLLNLLFGQDILPSHTESSTSVITRISYGKRMSAEIVYHGPGDEPERFDDIDVSWVHEYLWERLHVKDQDRRQALSHIREIRFQIPSEILKCGLVIVDSPGIGENEAMDSVIADFIQSNEIMGYVYVIKSDNSGGVDEDRLLGMLKMVIDKQKKTQGQGLQHFDSGSAMFVCNRWDLVRPDQQTMMLSTNVKRLQECWPDLSSSQVITFKTEHAMNEAKCDPDFIPELYRVLLERLRDMYIHAMDYRIEQTYKWLAKVFKRSIYQLRAVVGQMSMSEDELKDRAEQITAKLHILQSKSEVVLAELREDADEAFKAICLEIRLELKKPYANLFLKKWLPEELPKLDQGGWITAKETLHSRIAERVIKVIEDWESDEGRIAAVEERTSSTIRSQLNLLQGDMRKIEDAMDAKTEMNPRERLRQSLSNPLILKRSSLRTSGSDQSASYGGAVLPMKMVTRVLNPVQRVMENVKSTKVVDRIILKRKEKAYRDNPTQIAKERAEKFLQKLIEPRHERFDILQMMVSNLMERSMYQLSEIERSIPALVKSNEQLLEHAQTCRKSAVFGKGMYENLRISLESTERRLLHYYKGYISVKNMRDVETYIPGSAEFSQPRSFRVSDILHASFSRRSVDLSRSATPGGLWTVIRRGMYSSTDITMKMYLPSSRVDTTYTEVAKLRFLKDPTIAPLEGIHYSDAPPPVFIFQDRLYTVSERLSCWSGTKSNKFTVLQQTIEGLAYLHRHRLVHMEICLDTVTVNSEGEVKLTGSCLPRKFIHPSDRTDVGNFVYLAPNVLRGDLYSCSSDIYGLGILVFELLLGVKAFSNYRDKLLADFVGTVDPEAMMDPENDRSRLSVGTSEFVMKCLHPSSEPDMSPTIDDARTALSFIRGEKLEIIGKESRRCKIINGNKER